MKKTFSFLLGICAVFTLFAQPSRPVAKGGFNLNWVEQMAAKTDYAYRMTGFTTSDNYQFCTFHYHPASGRLVAIHDSVQNDYNLIDSLFYDAQGRLSRLSGWQQLNGIWENVYYIDYTYDPAGNIATRTNYNNFGGNWELGGVYNYTYNADNQILLTTLTMSGREFQRVEYTYADRLLQQELWYDYSFDAGGLQLSEKLTYHYADGRLTAKYDSLTENGSTFTFQARSEYSYDADGNCTEYAYYDQSGQVTDRSIYTFNHDMPLSSVYIPWTPEINRPKTYTNTHAYDVEAWYGVDENHVLHYVCDYLYTYQSATNGLQAPIHLSLRVSPNPASDVVKIAGLGAGEAEVSLYDMTGRRVLSSTLPAGERTVGLAGLPAGCYVLRVVQQGAAATMQLMML